MSNGWRLEFGVWGDDSLRLAFWDSLHGEDEIYRLDPDGTIWKSVAHPDNTEEGELWEQVNLHDELRAVLTKLDSRP